MSATQVVLALFLLNLGFVAFLSVVFFKPRGVWNLPRFFSLLPFLVCTIYLILVSFNVVRVLNVENPLRLMAAVFMSVGSFILTASALGSHQQRVALCHQPNEIPDHLVTWGAYSKIRHPFYTAHLLILLGVFTAYPNVLTGLVFLDGLIMLTFTAVKEENEFRFSPLKTEYEEYMKRTGRFLPRIGS